MVYLQLMLGLGVGLLGVGIAYFFSHNRMSSSMPYGDNSHGVNRASWDNDNSNGNRQKRRKALPGDKCPICLIPMQETDMRFLICEHAMHHLCYEECRAVRKDCPTCGIKFAELSEEGDECVICFEKMNKKNMEYLKCEHALHVACLRKYREMGNRICPLCRKSI